MAFGFFKKREYADIVFKNGTIYTMDPNQPQVEAVACKDGMILLAGDEDDMEALTGPNTEVVDLEGQFLLPGFIKLRSAQAQLAFSKLCHTFPEWTASGLDGLTKAVKQVLPKFKKEDSIFLYGGFHYQLGALSMGEIHDALDQVCPDRPLLILLTDCTACLMNTAAIEVVKASAEEEGIRNISLDYIVSVIAPLDFEPYQAYIDQQNRTLTKEGFTTVHDCGSFDYPQTIYRGELQERMMEDQMTQRYLASYVMMEQEDPDLVLHKIRQRQTDCIELEGMIQCNGLHICLMPMTITTDTATETVLNFDSELLQKLAVDAADIGCDFTFTAKSQEALEAAAEAVGEIRDSGYKKNAAVLDYDDALSDKEIYEYVSEEDVVLWKDIDPSKATSVEQLLDRLTIDAAAALGVESQIGSIQKGKAADFTVLPKDPYKGSVEDFHKQKVSFTVLNGRIIS